MRSERSHVIYLTSHSRACACSISSCVYRSIGSKAPEHFQKDYSRRKSICFPEQTRVFLTDELKTRKKIGEYGFPNHSMEMRNQTYRSERTKYLALKQPIYRSRSILI